MAPSLHAHSSFTRPRTGDRDGRPTTRDQGDNNLIIPSRTSSLHSRITQPIPSTLNAKPQQRTPKTLTHAYMVCGVGREPSQWVKAPAPAQGKIGHMKGAVGQFWLPEILGSSPRLEQDNEIARSLHAAMRACFPHDVEICTGRSQPHCVHHAFVLQQDSSHTLYGICLRVWSRADEKRAETIRDLRKRTEPDYYDNPDETYWIPYCLSFLSRYPLYNLLGDYLRGMWIHWNKATNLFHAEEVSRILSFPAPRLNDLVRIDMKDYALCYQFPSSPTGFQNFAMWPLFCCLSIPNIVGVIEAAISPTRRIIFVSHYPAMLTMAAETVRYCVRVYEWSGLYVPVVHARHAKDLVQEPGPYILGITAECRSLFTAPTDALVVDLDRNFVLTSSPPTALNPSQRNKFVTRLTQSLNGDVTPSGVPPHLRSAYGGGKLVPAGQIIVMRGEVESIQDPEWWSQDSVMAVMDHVCEKMGRNTGIKAVFGGSVKKPLMTKVSMRHLNEIVRERNQYSRDALEAWQDFINLKGRMDTELNKVTKRNNYLNEELESWKQQFLKFQAFAEQLTKETQDLKAKIETHKRENRRLASLIDQQKDDNGRLNVRLGATEKQRDDALEALVLQQEIAEELERERKRNKKELAALQHTNVTILRQRDEARRVVLHLRSLIGGQSHHMEHLVQSLTKPDDLEREIEEGFEPEVGEDGVSPRDADANQARLLSAAAQANKRLSASSFKDVADRHLKDKTDAIAHIIRNIAEQCQAAVEGLQLAQDADFDERAASAARLRAQRRRSNLSATHSDDGHETQSNATSDMGDDSLLHPASGRISSIPPTPDLVPNRSSTAMSFASSAATPERSSQQYMIHQDIPTKIVEDDEDFDEDRSESETMPQQSVGKHTDSLIHRPSGARISALGGTR
ncbi:DENN domain-containing protein [Colletotrichum higginsianum]|uniref:DENN domain-containing protein n=2 Tax=Colletotrichum higginsianum TaxID=80884 RepID=H1UWY7_COLHI|nr:DENN domain-containing protein [Colletotrichum higginsianum IMI 349063]OBR03762.1 DENN domain-containing protein [Colletotrichum higginsianum IMI 349063]TIC97412.1 C-myc promoter-binding protein [Colletotrichum higginsianum]GJD01898.1 DENN domain-containing protein [Colletotrichum higginsianum]CCF32488.1 DENN domain-containing protein [Colletotrichum higginsianum]